MIITAEETEHKLRILLKKMDKGVPGLFCFHLNFAALGIAKRDIFAVVSEVLRMAPFAHNINLFLCNDGDVFITCKDWNNQIMLDQLERLQKKLPDNQLSSIVNAYDVWLDWDKLEQLIETKINAHNVNIQQQQQQNIENISQNVMQAIPPQLIASFAKRRNQRTQPLIMVADDDRVCRTLAVSMLDVNYSSTSAANGVDTIKLYAERAPDILFLDIGMPDMSGHDILKCIFMIDREAYVVMFSGHKQREQVLKSMEYGAKGFVGKPFARGLILEYINKSPFVQQKKMAMSLLK
jgi:CheY-like chemotaxis protein